MSNKQLSTSRRAFLGAAGVAVVGGLALGGSAVAQQDGNGNGNAARRYRVTVTNLTDYQPFTPPAVVAHRPSVELFAVGDAANDAIRQVAENGNLGPLAELAESTNAVRGVAVGEGPLVPRTDPGETGLPYFAELHLDADASARYLSFVSMLVATNDGFAGLDTVPLPRATNESRTYYAASYDAGTERNTEMFADMVPPAQSLTGENREGIDGTGQSNPDIAEDGVVTPHPGITGIGDVPEAFDWDDPVAIIQVERVE
ncbi:spondin domain-containing protein [Halogeometricum limi]|nr:spondin domain-containing protein [Halogeometricum limi]